MFYNHQALLTMARDSVATVTGMTEAMIAPIGIHTLVWAARACRTFVNI